MRFACNDQELLAEQGPGERQAQVKGYQPERWSAAPRHGIGEKARAALDNFESRQLQQLGKGLLGQRYVVIPKIPVGSGEVADIGPEADEQPARLQAAAGLVDSPLNARFVREMLEEVAGEDHVQVGCGKRPGGRAVLIDEVDIRGKAGGAVRVAIHGMLFGGDNVVDELPPAGTDIQDAGVGRYIT